MIQQCPHCGYKVALDEQQYKAGSTVKVTCPHCGSVVEFTITETSDNPWIRILSSPLIPVGLFIIIGTVVGVRSEKIGSGLLGGLIGLIFGFYIQFYISEIILYAIDKNRRNKEDKKGLISSVSTLIAIFSALICIIAECRGMTGVAIGVGIVSGMALLIGHALSDIFFDDDSW